MDSQRKARSQSKGAITCIKLLLHIFNFLYMIIGVCVLAIGIWTQVQLKQYMELSGLYYSNTAYVMVGVGIVILLVAIGGFYCTAKDKIALLYMYGFFISLLAIVQVGAGIAGAATAGKLSDAFEEGLTTSLTSENRDMDAWNTVQSTLKCCGVNNASDWGTMAHLPIPGSCYTTGVAPPRSNTTAVPVVVVTTTNKAVTTTPEVVTTTDNNATTTVNVSTTTEGITTTTANVTEPDSTTTTAGPPTTEAPKSRRKRATSPESAELFITGCRTKIVDAVDGSLGVIVGVCIGFVLLQVIGAVLACCLAKKTSKNNYEQIY